MAYRVKGIAKDSPPLFVIPELQVHDTTQKPVGVTLSCHPRIVSTRTKSKTKKTTHPHHLSSRNFGFAKYPGSRSLVTHMLMRCT